MAQIESPFDRFRVQFKNIHHEFAKKGVNLVCDDPDSPSYVYVRDHLIVRDAEADVGFVASRFRGERVGQALHGTQLMKIKDVDARHALEQIRNDSQGGEAALNHLITVAEDVNLCPSDEPILPPDTQPTYPGTAATAVGPGAGQGVIIDVIDTGVVPDYDLHEWTGTSGGIRLALDLGQPIPLDYGHGTFIAGILDNLVPRAKVNVANDFRVAGALTECGLRDALERSRTQTTKPDIISLSVGGTSQSGSMMGLRGVVNKILEEGTVLVAAAGNNGNNTPFFPAAFQGVISVGAIDVDHSRLACFSNYGDWVSVYAPGERLVNDFAFDSHPYKVQHEQRQTCRFRLPQDEGYYDRCTCVTTRPQGEQITFNGRAQWSGTSFATPIVAGLIAARKGVSGESAKQAAEWLLRNPAGHINYLGRPRPFVLPRQPLT